MSRGFKITTRSKFNNDHLKSNCDFDKPVLFDCGT
jgi:hypothetical protein